MLKNILTAVKVTVLITELRLAMFLGGNCYCDPLCVYFGDCCDDAPKNDNCSTSSGEQLI